MSDAKGNAMSDASTTPTKRPDPAEDPDLPPLQRTLFWSFCQQVCRFVCTVGFSLKCYHQENVPLEGGVLLLSSHQSFLDPPFVACKLDRAVVFLARSTLFKGLLGKLIRALHAYPIERGKPNVSTMKKMINIVQSGRCLLMFPEGTRTADGDVKPLESGMALIVKKARVPVVPVAIDGAFKVWPRHRKLPTTGRVRVMYGKPMMLHDLDSREIVERVEAEMRRMLAELRAMDQ